MSQAGIDHQIDVLSSMQNNAIDRMVEAIREEKLAFTTDLDGAVNEAVTTYRDMPLVIFNTTLEAMALKMLSLKTV